ncbi:hypothetical protein X566_12660 [Afipia sp. P52-10]|uniref:glycosyltransferase family 87 protein n=1 Tax=Afipia sp. P52-10 TaxID=1429916 RepID=UPI0003DEFC23|nr:glycosyltransferase family 87 protein [Afipia sp. P52-10]ETR78411.1 hypothetical protein X566_12660 [Afipia sp. P52-10]
MSSTPSATIANDRQIPELALKVCFALAVLHVVYFPVAYLAGGYIFTSEGLGHPSDFVTVWSAGRMVMDGHAALVYDWTLHKQVQVATLGQGYPGNLGWHYPPPYLFIATGLAYLPYAFSYPFYAVASFIPYAGVMRGIVGRPVGWLLALSFPVVFANAMVSQNGFVTAALIGGTLLFLPTRPILAGVFLGLLTYKPQYGILFPIILIATQQWRTFFSASVVALLLAVLSWVAFGTDSWIGFFHGLSQTEQAFLSEGRAGWDKLQSLFATIRFIGGSERLAWACQFVLMAAVVVTVVVLWRSRVRYAIKAAGLATGVVLATPYLFLYDMMVLAVAVAFLVRDGLRTGFKPYEWALLALAFFLLCIFVLVGGPTGFGAAVIIAAITLARSGLLRRDAPPLNVAPSLPA